MSVKEKYNRIARFYEYLKTGDSRRWKQAQSDFFKTLKGNVLYVGMGPGPELENFPPGLNITAIDLSFNMLEKGKSRAEAYSGNLNRLVMDVQNLGFQAKQFDSIVAVCVFCTVVNPVAGFKELRRVLKPGGQLFLFEHVLSKNPLYGIPLRMMSLLTTRLSGTHLDRNTVANVEKAGWKVLEDNNIYLDIVKAIRCEANVPSD